MQLNNIAILGLGLLGGSLGLAVQRAFGSVRRTGYSHRDTTRAKAIEAGAVDQTFETPAAAVNDADLVVLATPISTFEPLFAEIAPALKPHALVTDVGSTKVLPVQWAQKHLPPGAFLGSHPMAGSEQRGVDFARADLFEGRACILTPTENPPTPPENLEFLQDFWQSLGMRVHRMPPDTHDQVLARISHLPHLLAAALVRASDPEEMLLCGKGFLDTTRIASGPISVWRDIILANAQNTAQAVHNLINELKDLESALQNLDEPRIVQLLEEARTRRNHLVEQKLHRGELPD